ncbi:MAG: rubrerythrin family protein, partial [Thermomicrobium sp.]|nr:rubrerythrin family protein [Thermomicrobium sp.]
MSRHETIQRYRQNLQDEVDSAALYTALAAVERSTELREVFRRLAAMEEEHARLWQRKLAEAGIAVPMPEPGWRTRVLIWVARRFGPAVVLPTVTAREWADQAKYDHQPEATASGLPET